MTSKIGNIVRKMNEVVGAIKATADYALVCNDGVMQKEMGGQQ